jgi:ATPase family associated with various cellular activities (AAA)/Winged helix domain, variant
MRSMGVLLDIDARIREAVEGVVATDVNPADPFRGLYISDDLARSLARASSIEDLDSRISCAGAVLGLGSVDVTVLALCAAPELSPRYGRLLAYLHDDVTRKLVSPRLAARLLADDSWPRDTILERFAHDAPLRRNGAIRLLPDETPSPLADRLVKVPDRLAAYLLGVRLDACAHDGMLRRIDPGQAGRDTTVDELRRLLAADPALPLLVAGPDSAAVLATALEQPLLLLDAGALGDTERVADAGLTARLEERRLCFAQVERLAPADRARVVSALGGVPERPYLCASSREAALLFEDETVIVVETTLPSYAERAAAWRDSTGADDVRDVASKFRLSIGQIGRAAEIARISAAARGADRIAESDLNAAARQASLTRLGDLATRVSAGFSWSDLILPPRQLELLRSISAYLRHRDLVLSEWGYGQAIGNTQGLKVLFAGESGTGKTMSAQVVANELGLDLFRIDLATVVSKYIGETEKNLDRIFAAAEGSNAILFFDEADALFGKRSEVSDAHDRYANIEVAYLLQKMEAYEGAVVLATNLRRNIDNAFLRRLDFVIDFPFPEPEDRARIWRLLLPSRAPLTNDLDLDHLAREYKLSGGGIRNSSLAAAFLAADDGGVITMDHLLRGVAIEYGKLGRLVVTDRSAEGRTSWEPGVG